MKLSECSPLTWMDAMTLLCEDLVGSGISRQVYAHRLDPTCVIKLQIDRDRFQNQREWAVWDSVRESKAIAAWFAPCLQISDAGIWLVQRRTQPVTLQELKRRLPRVPAMFTDLKADNWGRLGSRLVCHDYGTALTTEYGITTKMRRADWWD